MFYTISHSPIRYTYIFPWTINCVYTFYRFCKPSLRIVYNKMRSIKDGQFADIFILNSKIISVNQILSILERRHFVQFQVPINRIKSIWNT